MSGRSKERQENSLGARLTQERLRLGLSQESLGLLCGVGKVAQLNYEHGYRAPSAKYLQTLEEIGVDAVFVLLGRRDGTHPSRSKQIEIVENALHLDVRRAATLADLLFDMLSELVRRTNKRSQPGQPKEERDE